MHKSFDVNQIFFPDQLRRGLPHGVLQVPLWQAGPCQATRPIVQSNPIQSNPIQSNPIQSNPIQCRCVKWRWPPSPSRPRSRPLQIKIWTQSLERKLFVQALRLEWLDDSESYFGDVNSKLPIFDHTVDLQQVTDFKPQSGPNIFQSGFLSTYFKTISLKNLHFWGNLFDPIID